MSLNKRIQEIRSLLPHAMLRDQEALSRRLSRIYRLEEQKADPGKLSELLGAAERQARASVEERRYRRDHRPRVSSTITGSGLNIKSVVTSQTCISFLLARRDLDKAYQAVQLLSPKPYRRLEKVQDVALVGIVGKGLLRRKGIAARCFTAVAERNVNVEMISFGPSEVAVYFLVRNKNLQKAVEAIHATFFSEGV